MALSGTLASAKSLVDGNSTGTVGGSTQDTVNNLSSAEATNLVNTNENVRNAVASSLYFKDIGSRKGLSPAESDIEYANAGDSVKNVYSSKAVTDVNKLVVEGYIKIDRNSNDVAIENEKATIA